MARKKTLTKEKVVNIARSNGYFSLHRHRANVDAWRAAKEAVQSGELEYAGYWLSHDHYRIPKTKKVQEGGHD